MGLVLLIHIFPQVVRSLNVTGKFKSASNNPTPEIIIIYLVIHFYLREELFFFQSRNDNTFPTGVILFW